MQAAPFIHIRVERFGCWHSALALLAVLVASLDAAWLWKALDDGAASLVQASTIGAAGLAAVSLTWQARQRHGFQLRWDTQRWWYFRQVPGSSEGEGRPGDLSVALDFGQWLLLKLTPSEGSVRQPVWLPIQRDGLSAQWHALRCAVYSPRPSPAEPPSSAS